MTESIGLSDDEFEFVKALNELGVRFLVVGGRAVRFYSPERATADLDVLIGHDGDNLVAAMDAMGRMDPRYFRKRPGEGAARPGIQAHVDLLGRGHADVLTSIVGVDFEEAWRTRRETVERGLSVPVLSIDQLIANKQAQADDKGRADLELLLSRRT